MLYLNNVYRFEKFRFKKKWNILKTNSHKFFLWNSDVVMRQCPFLIGQQTVSHCDVIIETLRARHVVVEFRARDVIVRTFRYHDVTKQTAIFNYVTERRRRFRRRWRHRPEVTVFHDVAVFYDVTFLVEMIREKGRGYFHPGDSRALLGFPARLQVVGTGCHGYLGDFGGVPV